MSESWRMTHHYASTAAVAAEGGGDPRLLCYAYTMPQKIATFGSRLLLRRRCEAHPITQSGRRGERGRGFIIALPTVNNSSSDTAWDKANDTDHPN